MTSSPERYANADQMAEDIEDVLFDRPPRHASRDGAPTATGQPALSAPKPSPAPAKTPEGGISANPNVGSTLPVAPDAPSRPAGLPRGPLTLPADKKVSLSFLSGPKQGREYLLRHASLLIGREGGNSGAGIELPETQISRMHAMVEARGNRYVLRDLESTFIGTTRVKEVEIEHGSEFQIGGTLFKLLVTEA